MRGRRPRCEARWRSILGVCTTDVSRIIVKRVTITHFGRGEMPRAADAHAVAAETCAACAALRECSTLVWWGGWQMLTHTASCANPPPMSLPRASSTTASVSLLFLHTRTWSLADTLAPSPSPRRCA